MNLMAIWRKWRWRIREAAINDYLADTADEVITIRRDGTVVKRINGERTTPGKP